MHILILIFGACRQRTPRGSGGHRVDQFHTPAGVLVGGKIHAKICAADIGRLLRGIFDIHLGGAGTRVFHHFFPGNGPVVNLRRIPAPGGAHLDRHGLHFSVARVAVGLSLPGSAEHSHHVGLRNAHAAVDLQQISVDPDARQVAPGHYFRLGEGWTLKARRPRADYRNQ